MSDGALVRTALYDEHVKLDGNIVDFMGLNCRFGIPTLRRNILRRENLQVSLTYPTWAPFASLVRMFDNGLKV